jgi:nucleoside-diphosphate-sugar epimerase
MKVLLIGGTGFMGPSTARYLLQSGHQVTIFHRGTHAAPAGVSEIVGDHHALEQYRADFERGRFDVIVDFILSSERQAQTVMNVFRSVAGRVVAISSMDVYRAMGLIHGTETGALQPLPLTEQSELRRNRNTYSPEAMAKVRAVYPWVDDSYDKIPVEEVALGDRDLSGTVLRLPMVYGPGDPLHRFHYILKRIDDGRKFIIFSDDLAAWRTPRGFNENVGAAIALAATSDSAVGKVYNICEEPCFSELEWARKVADAVGWTGEFIVLPRDRAPQHLKFPARVEQHLTATSRRIRHELGFSEPVSLLEALKRTIDWERANQPEIPLYFPFDYAHEDDTLAQFKASA